MMRRSSWRDSRRRKRISAVAPGSLTQSSAKKSARVAGGGVPALTALRLARLEGEGTTRIMSATAARRGSTRRGYTSSTSRKFLRHTCSRGCNNARRSRPDTSESSCESGDNARC